MWQGATVGTLAEGIASEADLQRPLLAAVVLARDEEANIAECLRSLAWADKLCVLVDARTQDRTAGIAGKAGADVRFNTFQHFADQRNVALQVFVADWILFVDADERGTAELGAEVRRVIQQGAAVGWWVPRRNFIWGRWIRHAGWYPDYQLRLLQRVHARYDREREVHEIVILDGAEGYLEQPLVHYNYATVRQFLRKQDYYATYEARILVQGGVRPRLHALLLQPFREFWRRYITLRGFRDGAHGLLLSLLMGYYTLVAYWRARRMLGSAHSR